MTKRGETPRENLKRTKAETLRCAYSVAFHVSEDGRLHAIVGTMSPVSLRYSFVQLPEIARGEHCRESLAEALHQIAYVIDDDPETTWFTT